MRIIKAINAKNKKTKVIVHEVDICHEHQTVGYQGLSNLLEMAEKVIQKDRNKIAKLKDKFAQIKVDKDYFKRLIVKQYKSLKEYDVTCKRLYTERNDAVRSYNALLELGKTAEEMGIDIKSTTSLLPENSGKNPEDFTFEIKNEVLESGKVRHKITATPKKKRK
jgi:hypothetical protein